MMMMMSLREGGCEREREREREREKEINKIK